jgi:rapamycin-insensitive companion of mTOR
VLNCVDHPFLQAITSLLEETQAGTNLSRKALLLMGEVMHLANRLLPSHMAASIQV